MSAFEKKLNEYREKLGLQKEAVSSDNDPQAEREEEELKEVDKKLTSKTLENKKKKLKQEEEKSRDLK